MSGLIGTKLEAGRKIEYAELRTGDYVSIDGKDFVFEEFDETKI